jgi:hypothetical protein
LSCTDPRLAEDYLEKISQYLNKKKIVVQSNLISSKLNELAQAHGVSERAFEECESVVTRSKAATRHDRIWTEPKGNVRTGTDGPRSAGPDAISRLSVDISHQAAAAAAAAATATAANKGAAATARRAKSHDGPARTLSGPEGGPDGEVVACPPDGVTTLAMPSPPSGRTADAAAAAQSGRKRRGRPAGGGGGGGGAAEETAAAAADPAAAEAAAEAAACDDAADGGRDGDSPPPPPKYRRAAVEVPPPAGPPPPLQKPDHPDAPTATDRPRGRKRRGGGAAAAPPQSAAAAAAPASSGWARAQLAGAAPPPREDTIFDAARRSIARAGGADAYAEADVAGVRARVRPLRASGARGGARGEAGGTLPRAGARPSRGWVGGGVGR